MPGRRRARTALAAAGLALLTSAGCAAGADPAADSSDPEVPMVTITEVESASPRPTAKSGTPEPAAQPHGLLEITVREGEVVPEAGRHEVPLGEEITLRVSSDVADEVHVHGYDEMFDLEPGTPGEVSFTADVPGVFEVELEESGLVLVELQVE